MTPQKASLWNIPLVREIAIVLAIKVIVLLGIKFIWFDAPTVPADGADRVEDRLLGSGTSVIVPTQEEVRRDL